MGVVSGSQAALPIETPGTDCALEPEEQCVFPYSSPVKAAECCGLCSPAFGVRW